MKEAKQMDLVSGNLGLIAKIAWRYWQQLPPEVRGYTDLDDMIGEIVVQVFEKQHRYRKSRGAMTTFVHTVATNHCRSKLYRLRYIKKCRTIGTQSLSDEVLIATLGRSDLGIAWLRAKEPVERILADASPGLRRAFAHFLNYRRFLFSTEDIQELKDLAKRHHASWSDVRAVLVSC